MLLFPMVIPSRNFISAQLNTTELIIHQTFSPMHNWSKCVMQLHILQLKLGNIRVIFPNFQNCLCCKKDMKDTCNKHNSIHLIHKYSWIFDLGHYLFLKAHSSLKENYLLLGTDNVREQIPEAIVYTTQ